MGKGLPAALRGSAGADREVAVIGVAMTLLEEVDETVGGGAHGEVRETVELVARRVVRCVGPLPAVDAEKAAVDR